MPMHRLARLLTIVLLLQASVTAVSGMEDSTVQAFNARGNITQTIKYLKLPNNAERAITTSTAYGDSIWPDKPTSVTDALGRSTSMTYDSNRHLTSVIRTPMPRVTRQQKPMTLSGGS
jgi:YD repeat-containing protein